MESVLIVGSIRRTLKGAATAHCCVIAHGHLASREGTDDHERFFPGRNGGGKQLIGRIV